MSKEGYGPSIIDLHEPFQQGSRDPSVSTDHLRPNGKRRPFKRVVRDVNKNYHDVQDHANDILPTRLPQRGPNAGNIDDRNERRKSRDT